MSRIPTAARRLAGAGAVLSASLLAGGASPALAAGGHIEAKAVSPAKAIHWTEAKRRAAKPLPLSRQRTADVRTAVAGNTATGRPGLAGGALPTGQSALDPTLPNPSLSDTSTGVTPADGAFPGPQETWGWFGRYTRFPVSAVGKIFFSRGGSSFVCSGAVVDSSTGSVVWTAGHCVNSGGGSGSVWDSSAQFCPSYNASGVNPKVGCWNATSFGTTTEWFNSGDFARDVGILNLASTGTVKSTTAQSAVGALGLAWNFGRDQHWMDFGYPAASPYDGTKIITTAAEHRYDAGSTSPLQLSIGSQLTGGASGGPWLLSFSGSYAYINSVNSYVFTGGPNGDETGKEMQGPYFDSSTCSVYNFWAGKSYTC